MERILNFILGFIKKRFEVGIASGNNNETSVLPLDGQAVNSHSHKDTMVGAGGWLCPEESWILSQGAWVG